jgi:hypothetical protein
MKKILRYPPQTLSSMIYAEPHPCGRYDGARQMTGETKVSKGPATLSIRPHLTPTFYGKFCVQIACLDPGHDKPLLTS